MILFYYENLCSDATEGTHSLDLCNSYLSPEYLVLPPLPPWYVLDYLGLQLQDQPFIFYIAHKNRLIRPCHPSHYVRVCVCLCVFIKLHITAQNSMFARLGTDYEIRNQWFFTILETMTTD